MGFLKNIVKNAVSDGISKGISDAVSKAAEKIVAPKAEQYANKVADQLDEATQSMDGASKETAGETKKLGGFAALEASLNRMSQSAEKYAAMMEKNVASQEEFLKEWEEKLPGFPFWCFGGDDPSILEIVEPAGDERIYSFNVENATEENLALYVQMLKHEGFVRKYPTSDEVLYKDLGGIYLLVGTTDAFGTAPVMSITMQRTKDRSEIEA